MVVSSYHYLQLALAIGVIGVAVSSVWRIFRLTKVDAPHFISALLTAVRADGPARVETLLAGAGSSWVGQTARAVLATRAGDPDQPFVDEVLADQRYEASRGMLTLRIAMTLGSISGLVGALIPLLGLPAARRSLVGLVPGLPEQRAYASAMLAVGLGVAIAIVAGLALRQLRRRTKALYADSLDAATRLEQGLGVEE